MNIAIIGSGKIGLDLYHKAIKEKFINNIFLFNRNRKSYGYNYAKKNGFNISSDGVLGLIKIIKNVDVILDATSSSSNIINFKKLKPFFNSRFFINLTPSGLGETFVPYSNIEKIPNIINLISCGGQSSIPLINAIKNSIGYKLKYVELVSSISSVSAGKATRMNINEYITNTSKAIEKLCGVKSKVMINLNPTNPPVNMMNTLFFETKNLKSKDMTLIKKSIINVNKIIKKYIPQYNAKYFESFDDNIFRVTIRVVGQGDYLPEFSGNLDIINSSSMHILRLINEKK